MLLRKLKEMTDIFLDTKALPLLSVHSVVTLKEVGQTDLWLWFSATAAVVMSQMP
jgi:hypothetical protein